jgi:hypothetical protein
MTTVERRRKSMIQTPHFLPLPTPSLNFTTYQNLVPSSLGDSSLTLTLSSSSFYPREARAGGPMASHFMSSVRAIVGRGIGHPRTEMRRVLELWKSTSCWDMSARRPDQWDNLARVAEEDEVEEQETGDGGGDDIMDI